MEKKSIKISKIILMICLFLGIGGFCTYAYAIHVSKAFDEKTFELGNVDISNNIEDYIIARNFMMEKATLNTSNVDANKVGDYTISCKINDIEYIYDIHIVDTTQPEITINNNFVYATYNEYKLEDFATASDLSNINRFEIISCKNQNDNSKVNVIDNTFSIETVGQYLLNIVAEDEYGNTTNIENNINVVEAPHFMLLNDRKYKINNTISLLDFVYAQDKDGNDITTNINVINDGGYDPNNIGTYEITYSVIDKDNIERKQTISIEINEFNDNDFGFEREEFINTLFDYDYFSYEPLENNEDFDSVVELTSPTSFSVKAEIPNSKCTGSAFLYKITENYLYFITNKHCSILFSEYPSVKIVDYSGNFTEVKNNQMDYFKSNNRDMMCFKVSINNFDIDDIIRFKEVAIESQKFELLESNQTLLVNTQEHGISYSNRTDRTNEVTLRNKNETKISTLSFPYPYLTINQGILKGGESGSPLFTLDGYLVGISASTAMTHNFGNFDMFITLPDIIEFMNTIEIE